MKWWNKKALTENCDAPRMSKADSCSVQDGLSYKIKRECSSVSGAAFDFICVGITGTDPFGTGPDPASEPEIQDLLFFHR